VSITFFNLHPKTATALRKHLRSNPATEAGDVSIFVRGGISTLREAGIDAAAIRALARIPRSGDDAREPVLIEATTLAALRQFLLDDWAGTGAGYTEFCARTLALRR